MFSFPLESNEEQTALKHEIGQMHGKKQIVGGLDSQSKSHEDSGVQDKS